MQKYQTEMKIINNYGIKTSRKNTYTITKLTYRQEIHLKSNMGMKKP